MRRQQKTPSGAYHRKEAVNPQGACGGVSPARPGNISRGESGNNLMEQVVSRENMYLALRRVEANKGAPGIDGVRVEDLRDYLREHRARIREELLSGTYKPEPVRRVETPKPGGGKRLLGIPTAVDRLIQQALLQVLTPVFDPDFSPQSFGFRPGRRGHDAVRTARGFIEEGYTWVVDMDLEKFFDKVTPSGLPGAAMEPIIPGVKMKIYKKLCSFCKKYPEHLLGARVRIQVAKP